MTDTTAPYNPAADSYQSWRTAIAYERLKLVAHRHLLTHAAKLAGPQHAEDLAVAIARALVVELPALFELDAGRK